MTFLVPILSAALLATSAGWQDTVTPNALHGLDDFSGVTYSPAGALLNFHGYSCDADWAAFGAGPPPPQQPQRELWGEPVAVGDGYAAVMETRCDAKSVGLAKLAADGR